MKVLETRISNANLEVRETRDGLHIRGYAAVFNQIAHDEVVMPSAFDRALQDGHDVRLLVNHEGVPLARTKSGTLRLSTDEHGLLVDAALDPANPAVQELASAMRRGDIDQMSFAFSPVVETRSADGVRDLREVKLFDASVVTYPWYEGTSVEMNSLDVALKALRSGTLSREERDLILVAINSQTGDITDASSEMECDPAEQEQPMTGANGETLPVPEEAAAPNLALARLWF